MPSAGGCGPKQGGNVRLQLIAVLAVTAGLAAGCSTSGGAELAVSPDPAKTAQANGQGEDLLLGSTVLVHIGAPFSAAVRSMSKALGPGTDNSDPNVPALCHDPQFDQIEVWPVLAVYGFHGRVVGYQYSSDDARPKGDPRLHTRSGLHLYDTVQQAGQDYPNSRPEGSGYFDDASSLMALYDNTQRITTIQSGQVCTY